MTLGQDIRYAFRTFLRNPGLVAAVVVSIGLGVAANSTVFSVINSLLWGSLPVREPDRLMAIGDSTLSWLDYQDMREGTRNIFENGITAYFPLVPATIGGRGEPERIWGQAIASNYWSVAGAQPAVGRAFTEQEDKPGASPVVILTYGLWQRRFGGDPNILGKSVLINGGPYEVVGVAPPGFAGTLRALTPEFWVPLGLAGRIMPDFPSEKLKNQRTAQWLMLNARLASGVSRSEAQVALNVVKKRIDDQFRKKDEFRPGVALKPAGGMPFGDAKSLLGVAGIMMVVVGLVLLIACANVANLLLARAAARQKEIGIRLAIGASRGRLIMQLLTESVLLSLGGAAFGIFLAFFATKALSQLRLPFPIPITFDFTPDIRVFLFTVVLAVITGIVFGIAPALRGTRSNLVSSIKEDSGALGSFRRFGLRNVLVVAQVSLSLVLLVGATLFVRSLRNATRIDLGFRSDNVLMMTMDPKLLGYDKARQQQFLSQLRERVKALPGVASVSYLDSVPLSFGGTNLDYEAKSTQGLKTINGDTYNVGAEFFSTFAIPILRGREFDVHKDSRFVVVVNEAFAREAFGNEEPLGRSINIKENPVEGGNRPFEVIGVARNSKSRTIGEDAHPCVYLPLEAAPEEVMSFYGTSVVIKSATPPRQLEAAVREQVRLLDPNMPVHDPQTLQEQVDKSMLMPKVCATLLGVFGGVGLILATVGLYGVIAYSVRSRVKEIGVRMALGAPAGQVSRMVTLQGLALIGVGVVIGLAISFAGSRFLASLLYGISTTDIFTFVAVPVAMLLVGLAATALPARRAARVDPMEALRYE
jgi:predicted permease